MEDSTGNEQTASDTDSKDMNLLSLTGWIGGSIGFLNSTPSEDSYLNLREEQTVERVLKQIKGETSKTSAEKELKNLKTINLDEVAWHDTADSCWIVIHDFVYDCTDFLNNHPGGSDVILEYAGRDATLAFIGTGHSKAARLSMERYLIGELPPEERIFRIPNGLKVAGF
ncbi:cytochrome b5 isoform X1 [Halictus rubicundus]|uniref:cytochrome b5 isoform X1 n=2 Tax=Halictus rubicundus TaxID=77578 RepID=UPI0040373373